MKAKAFINLCLLAAVSFCQVSNTAYAADVGFCNAYADTAVQQYQRGQTLKIANLSPPVWSDNRPGHYKWCLSVSQALAEQNTQHRERILNKQKPSVIAVPMQIPPSSVPQGPASNQEMIRTEPMPLPQATSDQTRPLTGDEIRSLINGNTIAVRRLETGAITLAYLRPYGVVALRTPQGQEFAGAWSIEGDTYCSQVEQLREGRKACARLVESANHLFAYPPQGDQAVAEINILPGNPENLGMMMTGQPAAPPGVGMQPEPVLPGPGGKPRMPPAAAIENLEVLPEAVLRELAAPLSRTAKIEALLANPKMATELKNFAAKAGMQVDQLKSMSTSGFSFLDVPIMQMSPGPDPRDIDWKKGVGFSTKFNFKNLYLETVYNGRHFGDKLWEQQDFAEFLLGDGPAGVKQFRAQVVLPKVMLPGTYIFTLRATPGETSNYYGSQEAQASIDLLKPAQIPGGDWNTDYPNDWSTWGESVQKSPMQPLYCSSESSQGFWTCGYVLLVTATNTKPEGSILDFTITDFDKYRIGRFYFIEIEQL